MKLMTASEVAKKYGVSYQSIYKLRKTGKGPKYIQLHGPNSPALYDPDDVDAWIKSIKVDPYANN